jgi:hypothetical protein
VIDIVPQQELFTALKLNLEQKGSVYDGVMPSEDTPYPFYFLGENQQIDKELKGATHGTVHQTIGVWHYATQRGTLSDMMLAAKAVCRNIKHTANFSWTVRKITQRIKPDNTTKTPLLHGIVEVEFYFS